ncbi:MAG: hypothetical protein CMP16_00810 [Rickettsiales bacterium]|nr:hypothetical protein [Rickettsiales bacterium]
MCLLPPSNNLNNSKLYFSKSELSKILNCYSNGVSKGNWKDYSIDFNKNEAVFFIYKHSFASPECKLSKLKLRKKNKIIYKLSFTNNIIKKFNNIDTLISSLKRKQISII